MSVSVKFVKGGNAGNQMFPYITAIIFCSKHNLQLITKPTEKIEKFIDINDDLFANKDHNTKITKKRTLTWRNFVNHDILFVGYNVNYVFNDFFQNSNYINKNYDHVIKNINIKPYCCIKYLSNYKPIQDNDILCILRLGDFIHNGKNTEIVSQDYFSTIFESKSFDFIYFLIHPYNDKHIPKYLKSLEKYKDKFIFLNERNEFIDFNIVNHFKNIALTNSTFNWWSCFLCNNIKNINLYTPKYFGYCGIKDRWKKHGDHVQDLWNVANISLPIEHEFAII